MRNSTEASDNPDNKALSKRKQLNYAGTVPNLTNLYLQHNIDWEADD